MPTKFILRAQAAVFCWLRVQRGILTSRRGSVEALLTGGRRRGRGAFW